MGKKCRFCCQMLIALILGFIGLLVYRFYELGQFAQNLLINNDKCVATSLPQNCEDIVTLKDGTIIISCGALEEALQLIYPKYFKYQNLQQRIKNFRKNKKKKGKVYRVDFKDDNDLTPNLVELNMNSYIHPDFVPHGMSILYDKKSDTNWLYIVNHRSDGEYISVFKYEPKTDKLKYHTSITSDKFDIINNVQMISNTNGNFYVTNFLKNDPGSWSGVFEIFGGKRIKSVLYCKVSDNFLFEKTSKNINADCEYVDHNMLDANGVTLNNAHNELYVISGPHVHVYDTKTHNKKATINMPCGGDNINPNIKSNHDQFYVCIMCNPLDIVKHCLHLTNNKPPTNVIEINKKDNNYTTNIILSTDGTDIGACTGVNRMNNKLIAVSVFDNKLLVCNLF